MTTQTTKRMRQSLVNHDCLYKHQLAREHGWPAKSSAGRIIGTAYHAGLEELYRAYPLPMAVGYYLPAMVERAIDRLETEVAANSEIDWWIKKPTKKDEGWETTLDAAKAIVEGMVVRYVNEKLYWTAPQYEVLAVEHTFDIGGWHRDWTFSGTFDLVLEDKDNEPWLVVVDHKTTYKKWKVNKHNPAESIQAAWYILAAEKLWDRPATFAYDVMPYTSNIDFERRQHHRTREQLEVSEAKAKQLADLLDSGAPLFPNTASFLCPNYCDFADICPFGNVLNGGGG